MNESREQRGDYGAIETVTFVGGGDAGLMSALILKAITPQLDITVIDEFDEEIPEVGKSTVTYILHTFHNVLDIDMGRFISEVKPVWKASVYFTDWCGCEPFHVPFDGYTLQPTEPGDRKFETLYERYRTRNYHTLGEEITEREVSPIVRGNYYSNRVGQFTLYDQVAYHLSTVRLNEFLRGLCDERGIELIDDRITDVRTTDDNAIRYVSSERRGYESDLYVDATGFDRVLMGSLENEFNEFDFPLDSAVVAKTDISLSDIVPATVINTGEYGWFWQIDTFDGRDLGYVYSSEYVSDADAITEFIAEKEGVSESDVRQYRFDAGHYERAWVGNCIAVGNALGFVEPLQSTALTLNARLTEELATLLADHHRINHPGIRGIYNTDARSVWENVYDFISLHYRYSSGDNEFWDAMGSVNDDESLSQYVDTYRENGFSSYGKFGERGPTVTIFNQYLFYQLLRHLGVESDFYEDIDIEVRSEVKESIERTGERIARRASEHLSYEEVYQAGFYA